MHLNPPDTWFGAKRIGFGVGPRTWEGWALMALGVVVIVALAIVL